MHYLRRYRWYLFFLLGILAAGGTLSWFLLPRISGQWTLAGNQQRWSNAQLTHYRRNQQRWSNAQLTHYRYIFEQECFCLEGTTYPVIIEVKNGATISIRYLDDGTPVNPDFFEGYPTTIDELFARLQDALQQPGSRLDVTYHLQLGYPTKAAIDFDPTAIDDEYSFTVRNVEAIE